MADHPSEPIRADAAAGTAVARAPVAVRLPETRLRGRLGQLLERQHVLAGVLLAPTLLILILFIAYPFGLGLWLAVTDKVVGRPGNFIGLENFRVNLNDTIFLRAFQNTFVYTFIATFFKLALGMMAALLLNHHFRFKRIVRAGNAPAVDHPHGSEHARMAVDVRLHVQRVQLDAHPRRNHLQAHPLARATACSRWGA